MGGIAPLGEILRGKRANKAKEAIEGQNNTKGAKTLTMCVLLFPTSYSFEKGFLAVTLMLSKQRNRLLIHKRGDPPLYLTEMQGCSVATPFPPPNNKEDYTK